MTTRLSTSRRTIPISSTTNSHPSGLPSGLHDAGQGDSGTRSWLVSIRNQAEWQVARRCGARIIDFKEPLRGPLGPVDTDLWRWAADQVAADPVSTGPESTHSGPVGRRADGGARARPSDEPAGLSAALGEPSDALEIAGRVPGEFRYAKVGPTGCTSIAELQAMWSAVSQKLTSGVELVAVAYADRVDCPRVEDVMSAAKDCGFKRVLVDTCSKDGRSVVDHLGLGRLREIARWTSRHGIWWVLAGSIRLEMIAELTEHRIIPNCYGVRGDVCEGCREGQIAEEKLHRWDAAMASAKRTF